LFEIKDLHVNYGDMKMICGISLTVGEKEVVSLVGSNGAGKTTTLNTISGVIPKRSGAIYFEGKKIDHLSSHTRVELGLVQVPEGRRVFPEMTVYENLRVGSIIPHAKVKRAETMASVFRMFPILKERKGQLAGTLSGGEQQMLAIARALMSRPKILMLDEPSLGLAPLMVREIYKIINEINHQGMTVFLVEQNVKQALSLCDRAYVLENGRIVLSGGGQELLENDRVRQSYLGI